MTDFLNKFNYNYFIIQQGPLFYILPIPLGHHQREVMASCVGIIDASVI